jgi:hypothetical protein
MLKYSTGDLLYWWKATTLCEAEFGPINQTVTDKITGRTTNNHGKWEMQRRKIAFRYEKDLMFFLLKYESKQ